MPGTVSSKCHGKSPQSESESGRITVAINDRWYYATEAARVCLAHGFGECGIRDLVSFTTRSNKRSMAVMERIGMSRNPEEDFEHPNLPAGHPLRPHVLYRIAKP